MTAYRYWSVLITAAQSGDYSQLSQVEFLTGGVNHAIHKASFSVTSAYYGGFDLTIGGPPGSAGGDWVSGSPTVPMRVTYDFGAPITIEGVVLHSGTDGNFARGPSALEIDGSADNAAWNAVTGTLSPAPWTGSRQAQSFATGLMAPAGPPPDTGPSQPSWRIVIHSNAGNINTSFQDIEMAATVGGPNLCVGGVASASSELGGSYVAANAFDGTPAFWVSAGRVPPDQYIQYDFPSSVAIAEVRLKARPDGYGNAETAVSWDLVKTPDGFNLQTVQSFVSAPWTTANQVQTFPVTAGAPVEVRASQARASVVASSPSSALHVGQVRASVVASKPPPTLQVGQVRASVVAANTNLALRVGQMRVAVVVANTATPTPTPAPGGASQSFATILG